MDPGFSTGDLNILLKLGSLFDVMKGLSECGNCGNQFSIRKLFFEWQIVGLAFFSAFSTNPRHSQGARPPNKRVPNLTLDFSRVSPPSNSGK